MGLFDFLKKGKREDNANGDIKPAKEEFTQDSGKENHRVTLLDGGRNVQIEFYDPNMSFGQYYDTTKLIVDRVGHRMGNSIVNDCLISWYNNDEACIEGVEEEQEKILVTLDLERMTSDREYYTFAMKELLNRKRVQGYLERGRSLDSQEHPCGNYVGYIKQNTEGKFEKRFDTTAGEASHNSPYMMQVREQIRAEKEEKAARRKAELQAQIQEAQDELKTL